MDILSTNAARNPKTWFWSFGLFSIIIIVLVIIPIFIPNISYLPHLKVDTDPENMLASNEPVRIFNNKMKQEFSINDIIVVGVINETHPQGVFNKRSLNDLYKLITYVKNIAGVISTEIISP